MFDVVCMHVESAQNHYKQELRFRFASEVQLHVSSKISCYGAATRQGLELTVHEAKLLCSKININSDVLYTIIIIIIVTTVHARVTTCQYSTFYSA